MNFFGLVDELRSYCTTKGYMFVYGSDDYKNIIAGKTKIPVDKLILFCDPVECVPIYAGGRIVSMNYNVGLGLGRKSEVISSVKTVSSLDETWLQKHDNRLNELSSLIGILIGDISCNNELDVTNANVTMSINKFDINVDFVRADLTFVQG
jgi:hypothetical protein